MALCLLAPPVLGVATSTPAAAQTGPRVSLGDASGLERDDVIGSIFVPVTLSKPAAEPVTVSYYTVNDTAIYIPPEDRTDPELFGDYQRRGLPDIPRTVTVPAGSLQVTINMPLNIDDEVEPDEQFLVRISSVSGANATIGDDTGVATIVDSDGIASSNPAITVSDVAIAEGDSSQRRAQFQVHLSRAPASPVVITYATADGSATSPVDYVAKLPGTVVFAAGQISKTIDVLVQPDDQVGADRGFSLNVAVTGGSPVEEISMTGTATVRDDDQPPAPTISPMLAGGNSHTCALDGDGAVECWGLNTLGQLGTGDTTSSLTPVALTGLGGAASAVVAGDAHTCALTAGGGVKCWGNNLNGQLGTGNNLATSSPTDVVGLTSGVTGLAAGDNHTCAALAAGGIKCWGWGTSGQLGHDAITSSSTPVDVQGIPAGVSAVELSAGFRHTCAALTDGSARCWGRNIEGQLGNGSNTQSRVAITPNGLTSGVTAVVGGGAHTCVVQSGAVKCFGLNGAGQLGNGLTTSSNVPVAVSGLSSIARVAAGGSHSCALGDAGAISCWGLNQEGELGIGEPTTNNTTTPRALTSLGTGTIAISSGVQHVCAMAADESVSCWGINTSGQLGDGSTTRSFSPVGVSGLWTATTGT